jgi:uncharacterized sulfatase
MWTDPLYWGLTEDERRRVIRAYYASITFMDAQLGKLLDALDEHGLTENTIVVFLSDHGYLLTEHGQWMKMSLFEESARVPLIISAPKSAGNGTACSRMVELIDVYPTLSAICELEAPAYLQGKDLRPLLTKPTRKWDSNAYTQVLAYPGRVMGRSVRTERWRYTEWGDGGSHGAQLYDHRNDAHEFYNLANESKLKKLRGKLGSLLKESAGQ